VVPLKALAREHWGDFGRIAASAPRSHRRSILVFLRDHPTAFRKAVNLMEPRLLGLFLQALQSWLWNRIVSAYLEALARSLAVPLKRVALPPGEVVWPEMPPSEFVKRVGDERLPLPQSRAVISDAAMREAAASVLKSEGVAWRDLKARSVDRAWLSRGDRAVWVRPRGVRWLAEQEDDLHPGRRRVSLKFSLPPGSYASILLGALEYDGGALAE
jgi:tRNA pseudouridine13 synthase